MINNDSNNSTNNSNTITYVSIKDLLEAILKDTTATKEGKHNRLFALKDLLSTIAKLDSARQTAAIQAIADSYSDALEDLKATKGKLQQTMQLVQQGFIQAAMYSATEDIGYQRHTENARDHITAILSLIDERWLGQAETAINNLVDDYDKMLDIVLEHAYKKALTDNFKYPEIAELIYFEDIGKAAPLDKALYVKETLTI